MTSSPHMEPDGVKLIGLHRAEFERAKADQRRAMVASTGVAALAFISLFSPIATVTYMATVFALFAASLKWFFSWRSGRRKATAERARRALFLMQGLGWRMSGKEMVDLYAGFSASESEGQIHEDNSYFDSAKDHGMEAMVEVIQESAFWSKHLYSLSAKQYWLYSAVSLAIAFVLLLILPTISNQYWSIAVARSLCLILMFLVAIDLLGMGIAYSEAARTASNIDDRLMNIVSSGSGQTDVLSALGDYNAVVQETPLIPSRIYEQHKERLGRLWKQRRETIKD